MINKSKKAKPLLSLIMAIALCLSLAIPAFAAPAPATNEVIASSSGGTTTSDNGAGIGQSFTAEESGKITSVTADLGHPDGFTDTMHVVCTIYAGNNLTDAIINTPDVLAESTIPIAWEDTSVPSPRTFKFSPSVPVEAGSEYTVVFTNNSASNSRWLDSSPTYTYSETDVYTGGSMINVGSIAKSGTNPTYYYASYSETTGDLNFAINADEIPISTYSIDSIPPQLWTGSPITPPVAVQGLTEGTHFRVVEVKNNVDPGTATVIVEGIGAYEGTLTAEFTIAVPYTPPATVTASETEPNDDPIAYLVDLGVIDMASFDPDAVVTRADLVVMLANAAGADTSMYTTPFYTDVSSDDAFFSAVNWASANGVVLGYGDGMFNPDGAVTRQDVAAILLRYADYMSFAMPQTVDPVTFDDNGSIYPYAQAGVAAMQMAGVMSAAQANDFGPMMNVNGYSIADILAMFLQLM